MTDFVHPFIFPSLSRSALHSLIFTEPIKLTESRSNPRSRRLACLISSLSQSIPTGGRHELTRTSTDSVSSEWNAGIQTRPGVLTSWSLQSLDLTQRPQAQTAPVTLRASLSDTFLQRKEGCRKPVLGVRDSPRTVSYRR